MKRRDLLLALGLAFLAFLFFAPVLIGGRTLIPFDDLYRFPPWNNFASQFGIVTPKNELALDLVLENYVWKKFIVDSIQAHELPLWNPYLFAGLPFLAAGQHSAYYPFSVLFYVLPIERAYGLFTALQFALAAINMFIFARILGLGRAAGCLSALTYAFSGFMAVSTTFPMIISAAAWLPAILACVHVVLASNSEHAVVSSKRIIAGLIGAALIGIQFLAGHVEISIYILLVTAFFAFARGLAIGFARAWLGWLGIAAMTGLGIALAAVQLVPLFELVQQNFRRGSVTFNDVIGWAFPPKQLISFLIPDFFGNPTHHSYLDVFNWTVYSAPSGTIFWGPKNYVEAGAWVGILPITLAAFALLLGWNRATIPVNLQRERRFILLFFSALAAISLLFVFGTPLYGILFFGIPGLDQLHSPFRWVLPYTLSLAVLAGMGAETLRERSEAGCLHAPAVLGKALVASAIAIIVVLLCALLIPAISIPLADRALSSSTMASATFDTGRMFLSYEFRNFALLAVFVLGSGIVFFLSGQSVHLSRRFGGTPLWVVLAVLVTGAELFVIGTQFFPTADPILGRFTPPAVEWLRQDSALYRITSYDNPGTSSRNDAAEKVFNANAGMLFGISDIRGYDSIIPKQYADLMGLLAPQGLLLANRIAPFYHPEPLSSQILNLLNVKYVLTKRPLPNAGYTLVYDSEIQIYRNDRVLPRAFMVPQSRVISDRALQLSEMTTFDPSRVVLLDQAPSYPFEQISSTGCEYQPVDFVKYIGSEVEIKSSQPCSGWLVLSDSYFPGWIAQVDGQETELFRADYNFRAVHLPSGEHSIRFKYSPISFKTGALASFLAGMVVLMGFAYVAWRRFYRPTNESPVQTVAKNSLLPMATSLLLKALDILYAFFWLRMLGPAGTGRYTWAVNIWFFANTIADFGLGLLLTREVTRDRSQANRYLANSLVLRVVLWGITILPFASLGYIFGVSADTQLTIWLLLVGILPATLSSSLAYLFNAYEKFEYRVAIDMLTRILSITLGVLVLVLGYGIVGLAGASIITNLFTLLAFYVLVDRTLFRPHFELDGKLVRTLFFESYPLMLNNLLSSLFFRIDVFILQPLKGELTLGYYSTAYRFIDALNFIPSNFTLAIFPLLARMASSSKDAMLRAYVLSLKLLLWIALPITAGTIFVSRELIAVLGGDAYLPHSAIALQVLIWFLPFSFINSVTHYVLIALGQQRFLTKAFIIGLVFNLVANLAAIPRLGYIGAALVTVLSEIVLLMPFYYSVRKNLDSIPFWSIAWRPAAASTLMGIALWVMLQRIPLVLAVPIAGMLYLITLIASGALGEDEWGFIQRAIPTSWRRFLVPAASRRIE